MAKFKWRRNVRVGAGNPILSERYHCVTIRRQFSVFLSYSNIDLAIVIFQNEKLKESNGELKKEIGRLDQELMASQQSCDDLRKEIEV